MSDFPEVMTPQQCADFVGVTIHSLSQDRYLNKGIPYVKHGGRVRYLKEDVIAYLRGNRVDVGCNETRQHAVIRRIARA